MRPTSGTTKLPAEPRKNGSNPPIRLRKHPGSTTVVGTGFLALDIVVEEGREGHPRTWAGGTCGNVLAILAYLGWKAYPVATLGVDAGAERIIADLTEIGVDVRFVRKDSARRTPIVIERIRKTADGFPRSRFIWTCPVCGARLPGYQAVLSREMEPVIASLTDPEVFFFDRVSRGALDLANAAANRGALVVFEPSGVGNERLFREALGLAHVLKYSHERLSGIGDRLGERTPMLEIETLGAEGLRYRLQTQAGSRGWRIMDPCTVPVVKDTVGAGDWCTAGLVHMIGSAGADGMIEADHGLVERALRLGQALAALTCAYEGARGGMYAMDKKKFRTAVKKILDGGTPSSYSDLQDEGLQDLWKAVCPGCAPKPVGRPRGRTTR